MDAKNEARDPYKLSRFLYILEAAFEYFISIAVGTVYLAKITSYIGFSDALTGIITSFVSLGCGFQIIAVFLMNKKPVKRWVTVSHIVSQIMFALIYTVPVLSITQTYKTVLLIALLLIAQLIHNAINSPKTSWFMSLVPDGRRGRFTADKEIFSLIGGVAFSYGLGALIEHYENVGDMRTAFIICSIGLFALMVLHTATLLLSKEIKEEPHEKTPVKPMLKGLFTDKTLYKIIAVSVLWNVANYATLSFTGTYQAKELAFTTTFSSVIIMVGSLVRAVVSRPIGALGDRFSFVKMLNVCFAVEAVAFGLNVFTSPANGKAMYFVFYVLYSIGMAGAGSSAINLLYDYVDIDRRTGAYALQQTCSGLAGFFITLCLSPLVSAIQNNGNKIFGITVYAQQVLSLISFVCVAAALVYVNTVVKKLKRNCDKNER